MSTPTHKRKRSIHDTPVDLTKMQLARQRLLALQEELAGIEETSEEMEQIMSHVEALQDILGSTRKLVRFITY
jgi:predicted component of type VI protein secretion system